MSKLSSFILPKYCYKTEKLCDKDFYENMQATDETIKEYNDGIEGSINLDIKLEGLSSSSSLSWSDEYESEVTKKIYEKLKRMDRVLKQQEDFPLHYDREEVGQWMRCFPNLSIFDTPSCDRKEQLLFGKSSRKRDKIIVHHQREAPVINSYVFTYNRLLMQRSGNNRKRRVEDSNTRNKNIFTISSKPKSVGTDRSLKITPIKNLPKHRDYTEFPPQFDSLPFIEINELNSENRKPSGICKNKKHLNGSSNLLKNTSLLILPPIQGDKLRSISATPSQEKPSKLFLI